MNLEADAVERLATYQRLAGRNRVVALLRIAVPVLGAILLVALVGQIYLSSLTARFGIGTITVTRDTATIEAPEYSGVLEDGSTYKVWAQDAKAALNATELVTLTDAALTIKRLTGVAVEINAPIALLDTLRETVTIAGISHVVESTGTSGTIYDSVFDYANQTLVAEGAVHIDYADGTTLDGVGMRYDVTSADWTFFNADVTLPSTPGAAPSETATP